MIDIEPLLGRTGAARIALIAPPVRGKPSRGGL